MRRGSACALAHAHEVRAQAGNAARPAEAHVPEAARVAGAVPAQCAARWMRKSASSGVGRPVLPFWAPL
jgi:hypothetical protein